jgi:hypothetical protein
LLIGGKSATRGVLPHPLPVATLPIYETSLRLQKWGGCSSICVAKLTIFVYLCHHLSSMPKAREFNGGCKKDSARKGYTPVNATEWDDAQEFLGDTFLPALRLSIGGTNVTATRARLYVTGQRTWRTIVELTYKGKRW